MDKYSHLYSLLHDENNCISCGHDTLTISTANIVEDIDGSDKRMVISTKCSNCFNKHDNVFGISDTSQLIFSNVILLCQNLLNHIQCNTTALHEYTFKPFDVLSCLCGQMSVPDDEWEDMYMYETARDTIKQHLGSLLATPDRYSTYLGVHFESVDDALNHIRKLLHFAYVQADWADIPAFKLSQWPPFDKQLVGCYPDVAYSMVNGEVTEFVRYSQSLEDSELLHKCVYQRPEFTYDLRTLYPNGHPEKSILDIDLVTRVFASPEELYQAHIDQNEALIAKHRELLDSYKQKQLHHDTGGEEDV